MSESGTFETADNRYSPFAQLRMLLLLGSAVLCLIGMFISCGFDLTEALLLSLYVIGAVIGIVGFFFTLLFGK